MPLLQFAFNPENLHATSAYLVQQQRYPTRGRTPEEMAKALRLAAIKSFKKRYQVVQSDSARPLEADDIEEEVMQTPILWHGIGAVFSSVSKATASGTVVSNSTMPFPVSDRYLIGVTFVVTLQ